MEISPPNMVPVCVPSTSVTKSHNLLPILAETSLPSLSTLLLPDTSHEAASLLKQIRCTYLLSQDQACTSTVRSTAAIQRDLQLKKTCDINLARMWTSGNVVSNWALPRSLYNSEQATCRRKTKNLQALDVNASLLKGVNQSHYRPGQALRFPEV